MRRMLVSAGSGDPSNDTQPLNGVILPGGTSLGFAFNTAAAYPTFQGAGPSGFGVLETSTATGQTIYHRFDSATNTFDTPPVTVSGQGEQQPAVSRTRTAATPLPQRAVSQFLSYSADGGTAWNGPNTLAAKTSTGISALTSRVNATGQGWAAWTGNGSVFAQRFPVADSVSPPAPTAITTSQTAGTTTGASISVPQGTVGNQPSSSACASDELAIGEPNTLTATETSLALSEKLAGHAVVTKHTLTVKITHPKRNKK
jgi:hypothetical protein